MSAFRVAKVTLCLLWLCVLLRVAKLQSDTTGTTETSQSMSTSQSTSRTSLQESCAELVAEQQVEIVNAHNRIRSRVQPTASDMRRMFWSEELAGVAQAFANQCAIIPPASGPRIEPSIHTLRNVGQNVRVFPECNDETNLTQIIEEWFQQGSDYDFATRTCYGDENENCINYLQAVWARSCEIGCAVAYCPVNIGYDFYFLVCNYFPGPPDNLANRRPYISGSPCGYCTPNYPECTPDENPPFEDVTSNLCYNEENVCVGSDPHFAIRLPEGGLLCYSFQGQHNSAFNLISNSQLEMNALFVPDSLRLNNTWIGSIGITVYHNGRKTTSLTFNAADKMIRLGSGVELHANSVRKISFNAGKVTIEKHPTEHVPNLPRVGVQFLDSDLEFTVAFIKNEHINLEWHSTGRPHINSRGVVGQFFRKGVMVDEDQELLLVPNRPPIPVIRRDLWKFMKHYLDESRCWTSVLPSNQGVGLIEGTWTDYKVDNLLAVRN